MFVKFLTIFNELVSFPAPLSKRKKQAADKQVLGDSPTALQTIRIFWSYAVAYKKGMVVALIALPVVILVQNGLLPMVYSRVIDSLNKTNGHIPHFGRWIVLFLSLHMIVFTGQRLTSFLWSKIEHGAIKEMEQKIFSSLIFQSTNFHNTKHGGSLVAQAKRFTGAFSNLMNAGYFSIYTLLFRIFIAFGFLLFIAPFIALVLLSWVAVYTTSIYWLTKRKMHASERAAASDSVMTARLADSIGNAAIIKMFGSENMEMGAYAHLSYDKYSKRRSDWSLSELIFAWQSLLMVILETVVLLLSVKLVQSGSFTIGKLALVQFFLAPILASLWQIAVVFRQVETSLSDASEMTQTLALVPDIQDPVLPEKVQIEEGGIQFKHVDFHYGKDETLNRLFNDFNLDIKPGQKIGLVGPSGSGKTSLTKLVLRFMDINHGQILIDGQDITAIRQSDLRQKIAFVPQEPLLFHRTIKENIKYADQNATDEQIVAAAKQARAHQFIEKLPMGYETMVGERGAKLSGGERQRIAIARAMLKDAPIVVLDEATSALDSESEKLIQQAFEKLIKGRTAIVIAHRLSTVRKMDRIVVLKDGQIIEDDNHSNLLKQKGLYAELWNHQAGGVIE